MRHAISVYLPGEGDAWTAWNHGTIVRRTQDGRWHPAAAPWGAAVEQAIARARRRPAPTCAGAVGPAVVHAGDPIYHDIAEIVERLDRHNVNVLCVFWSTLDGMFGSARTLGVMTRLGAITVFTFDNPGQAAAPLLSTSVVDGQLMTTVSVPGRERPDSVFGADRNEFVRYDRWVIDTFQQPALRAAVREALSDDSRASK